MNPPDKPDRIINKALAGDRPAVKEASCESGNRQVALRECLGEPEALRTTFQSCLDAMAADGVKAEVIEAESFAPARPQPTHRFDSVVLSEQQ